MTVVSEFHESGMLPLTKFIAILSVSIAESFPNAPGRLPESLLAFILNAMRFASSPNFAGTVPDTCKVAVRFSLSQRLP